MFVINKIVIENASLVFILWCKFFQIVHCLCVQLRKTKFVFLGCLSVSLSMRGQRIERERRQNKRENEQNERAKNQTITECETEIEKHNKQTTTTNKNHRGTCPEQPTQKWLKTPFKFCCCLGHHIVFWDGFGAGCGVVVFVVELCCHSHFLSCLVLALELWKTSGNPSMGEKCLHAFFNCFGITEPKITLTPTPFNVLLLNLACNMSPGVIGYTPASHMYTHDYTHIFQFGASILDIAHTLTLFNF